MNIGKLTETIKDEYEVLINLIADLYMKENEINHINFDVDYLLEYDLPEMVESIYQYLDENSEVEE